MGSGARMGSREDGVRARTVTSGGREPRMGRWGMRVTGDRPRFLPAPGCGESVRGCNRDNVVCPRICVRVMTASRAAVVQPTFPWPCHLPGQSLSHGSGVGRAVRVVAAAGRGFQPLAVVNRDFTAAVADQFAGLQ
jgi:hypothetical protein